MDCSFDPWDRDVFSGPAGIEFIDPAFSVVPEEDDPAVPPEVLVRLNRKLENNASIARLNEDLMETWIQELEALPFPRHAHYWLTFARLMELALLCAGNYADNAEFEAAGDLLVNPRLIRIHLRGRREPVIKSRHLPLSEHFREVGNTRIDVIEWLKRNTIVEIVRKPILLHCYESMKESGYLSPEYLASVDGKMKKIADAIALLACLHTSPCSGPETVSNPVQSRDRDIIAEGLCRFDTSAFFGLGEEFSRLHSPAAGVSFFLSGKV